MQNQCHNVLSHSVRRRKQRTEAYIYTGYTQKNGAVSIVFTIEPAPFFCVYSVCSLYRKESPIVLQVYFLFRLKLKECFVSY
jgi:hypothetical protein